jgi:D-alanyl-D-alanine carboxypeptidase (penicillin-binding protein 5/6)
LIVEKDLKVTMPRMAGTSGIKVQAVFKGPIEAPVKKGQEIGVVRVEMPNMKPIEIPAYAAKDIPRLGFFPSMLEKLERLVFGERVPSAYASTEGTAP